MAASYRGIKFEYFVKSWMGKLQKSRGCAMITECKAIKEMKFAYEKKTDDAGSLFCTCSSDYSISGYP